MDLLTLDPTQFENLTFDLVKKLGLINTVWRTPGSDVGRDIEGEYHFTDISGFFQKQKWYVECKRYTGSIDWPTIWGKIAYAEAQNCDVLLFSATSTVTPQARDQINNWNESKKNPTIRFWTGEDIISKLETHPQIAQKYSLIQSSDKIAGQILLPANKLLLKIINSLDFELKSRNQTKHMQLIQSVSELISKRLSELHEFRVYKFKNFNSSNDNIDSLGDNNDILSQFDGASIRALIYYLFFICKTDQHFSINKHASELNITMPFALLESTIEHLSIISELSNFIVNVIENNIKVLINE